jgi:hypothetical protein
MSRSHALDLYELLPALYRIRDAEQGYPLKALLEVLTEQADLIKEATDRQWDDLFIETCSRWIIPYIGDLVANNPLHDVDRSRLEDSAAALFPDLRGPDLLPDLAIPLRADVAKTIYYRRRKGTVPMLEELARDVTGWGARVVEFFQLLVWTQHLNHLRPGCHEHPDLRSVERAECVHGPFDEACHSVDVRRISQGEGWYNIPNIGFFLWRLRSYPLDRVPARPVDPDAAGEWRFHFSPLGHPAPLFTRWRREGDEAGLATELHTPGPIRRSFFCEDLRRHQELPADRPDATDLYGLPRQMEGLDMATHRNWSLFVWCNGAPVHPDDIVCWRLEEWPTVRPAGSAVAVDVEKGRIALGDGWDGDTNSPDVSYHHGFSADLGGGLYDRRKWLVRPEDFQQILFVQQESIAPEVHTSLIDALDAWDPGQDTLIRILDSRTYELPGTIELSQEHSLVIEAENGQRPVLQTPLAEDGSDLRLEIAADAADPEAVLTLSGVVVEGFLHVTGNLKGLRLLHCTLVPGRHLGPVDGRPQGAEPSLIVEGGVPDELVNAHLRVEIAASITGPLRLPEHAAGLWLLDAIVDGIRQEDGWGAAIAAVDATGPAPPATLERVTILGHANFQQLPLASEVIFAAPVTVSRCQGGCVRFSFVPAGSRTPRRYRCQPDMVIEDRVADREAELGRSLTDDEKEVLAAEVNAWLMPAFTAVYYGLPGYAQLGIGCPVEIRTGAEDGAEMGVFSRLWQPQRETNLRIRLEEYLPFGLMPGLIYVT